MGCPYSPLRLQSYKYEVKVPQIFFNLWCFYLKFSFRLLLLPVVEAVDAYNMCVCAHLFIGLSLPLLRRSLPALDARKR